MMHPADASTPGDTLPVVVVGAGMAGLTAAVALHEAGVPVRVYEADATIGGRLRTRQEEGFLLDEGFQVLLDAYPTVRRWIDGDALQAGRFDAGALLWTGRRMVPLANPLRHPGALARDVTTRLFPAADKLRLAGLAARVVAAPWQSARDAAMSPGGEVAAAEFLWSGGFSEAFVDRFARPFWGGITLDPHLAGSAGPLLFTLKMLLQGSAVLPAGGIAAVPAQLRLRLPADAVALEAKVTSVIIEEGRATGVRVARRKVPAAAVIVATEPPTAQKLTDVAALADAAEGVPSITVYLAGRRPPGISRRLLLDATRRLTVNHVAPLSTVQPTCAPAGQHLLAAVVVGEEARARDLEALAERVRADVALMLGHDAGDWRVVSCVAVPFSQFAQPPGVYRRLPGNLTPTRGLVLASEATVDSSLNGAMLSGEAAAAIVLRELAFAGKVAS